MSSSIYWQPLPQSQPPVEHGYQLKWVLVKNYGQADGSLKEGLGLFTAADLPYLHGVLHATRKTDEPDSVFQECLRLIDCIVANPQGVRVWIGDEGEPR